MQNRQFWKARNSFLELKKYLIDLKDIDLKEREIKIKREIEQLKIKLIFIEDINRFEKKEMKKARPVKNTWFEYLISCIP